MTRQIIFIVGIMCSLFSVVRGQEEYSQSYEWRTGFRDTLPSWVFVPEEGVVVGVSDPCLKSNVAREQAIQRALFLYRISQGVDVKIMFDYYISVEKNYFYENQTNKFIVLATLDINELMSDYEIVNEYFSCYGEAYLAIRVGDKSEGTSSFSASGEMMLVENKELRESREIKIFLGLNTQEQEVVQSSIYSHRGNSEYVEIESGINGSDLFIPRGRYMYADYGSGQKEDRGCYKLRDSFWSAEMESLLNNLVLYSFPSSYMKSMDDLFAGEKQELKREIVRDKIYLSIDTMAIVDNKLYVDWRIR